jgi:MerR family transcriptional regulator, thiopeptide resistance regulator
MQENTDWMWKYQSDEGKARLKQRPAWTPELQERVSRQWVELIAEVQAALGEDPASDKVQALAARWIALVEEFTGGDAEITAGVGRLYADQANWPDHGKALMKPFLNEEVWEFMHGAIALRNRT